MGDKKEEIPDQLSEIPANDAAMLRKIYGDQLNRVFDNDDDLDNEEPQTGPCCGEEGE